MKDHLNKQEWVEAKGYRWCNGYTDNKGTRVEGVINGKIQMTLTGQVYPIMAGTASDADVVSIVKAVDQFLCDRKLGGIRLNTNFGSDQPDLGGRFLSRTVRRKTEPFSVIWWSCMPTLSTVAVLLRRVFGLFPPCTEWR